MMDPVLLDDVLKLGEEVAAFRGKGSQSAAQKMSRLFGFMIMELVNGLRKSDGGIDLIPSSCDEIPSSAPAWETLKKLGARAVECVCGPQSRSKHTSLLRAEAWWQLGEISEVVRDPGHLAIALNVADNKRAPSKERQGAVEFLSSYWGDEEADEATVELLRELAKEAPDRTFLVTVMQARIELGLANEFDALAAVDDWDDDE